MINREDLLSGTRPEVGSRILMTVENNFQGYEIVDYKGMVWGISMRSKDMGQDFLMGCKQFTGGELSSYTENLNTYNSNTEVTAFGNAVVIKPIKNYVPTGGLGNILVEFYDAYAKVNTGQGIVENGVSEKIEFAKLLKKDDKVGIRCPYCNEFYNAIITPEKKVKVEFIGDADSFEPGQQIICTKCNKKFSVPYSE